MQFGADAQHRRGGRARLPRHQDQGRSGLHRSSRPQGPPRPRGLPGEEGPEDDGVREAAPGLQGRVLQPVRRVLRGLQLPLLQQGPVPPEARQADGQALQAQDHGLLRLQAGPARELLPPQQGVHQRLHQRPHDPVLRAQAPAQSPEAEEARPQGSAGQAQQAQGNHLHCGRGAELTGHRSHHREDDPLIFISA